MNGAVCQRRVSVRLHHAMEMQWAGFVSIVLCSFLAVRMARAESALELLSGFDQRSVVEAADWLARPQDPAAITGAARLLYQLRRAGVEAIATRATATPPGTAWVPGDVIELTGQATAIAAVQVPQTQAEVLELQRVFRFELRDAGAVSEPCFVITPEVPQFWLQSRAAKDSHTVRIVGIVVSVNQEGQPNVLATSRVQWYPEAEESVPHAGYRLLAEVGFDTGRLDIVREHDKLPLAADEPFFELLAAAESLRSTEQPPQRTDVIELLRNSPQHIGQWLRLPVETARVTKIVLDENSSAAQLIGQNHYWQIDAFAKLSGRVVIEVPAGDPRGQSKPVEFVNRYPVSLVAVQLPEPLLEAIEQQAGPAAVVAMVRRPLLVDGVYFRQWSYDSEFAQSNDVGLQFGPLLMASRITVRDTGPPVNAVDWQLVVAGSFLAGLAIIVGMTWWVGRRDRNIVKKRRQQEMDLEFPQST